MRFGMVEWRHLLLISKKLGLLSKPIGRYLDKCLVGIVFIISLLWLFLFRKTFLQLIFASFALGFMPLCYSVHKEAR